MRRLTYPPLVFSSDDFKLEAFNQTLSDNNSDKLLAQIHYPKTHKKRHLPQDLLKSHNQMPLIRKNPTLYQEAKI